MNQVVWDTFALLGWRAPHVSSISRLHVSDRSISAREFARFQRRSMDRDLCDLLWQCAEQFRYAHQLLKRGAPLPDWYVRCASPDLSRFYQPWDTLCARYRAQKFDPQIDFFDDQLARENARWSAFRQEQVFAAVLLNPDFTWSVLEQAGFLKPPQGPRRTRIERVFKDIIRQTLEEDDLR